MLLSITEKICLNTRCIGAKYGIYYYYFKQKQNCIKCKFNYIRCYDWKIY